MPLYEIEQYEIHAQKYHVHAANEAEAIRMLFDGEGEVVGPGAEYVEVAEDFGLPVEEYRKLAEKLESLGVSVGRDIIPSIRSIRRIKGTTRQRRRTKRGQRA